MSGGDGDPASPRSVYVELAARVSGIHHSRDATARDALAGLVAEFGPDSDADVEVEIVELRIRLHGLDRPREETARRAAAALTAALTPHIDTPVEVEIVESAGNEGP